MQISFRALVLAATAIFTSLSLSAGTLTTTTPNSGYGGIFLNLTPTKDLSLTAISTYFNGTSGQTGNVQVWMRSGSYVGFTSSSTGWTLLETVSITSAGQTTLASLPLNSPIDLISGQTTAFYLAGTNVNSGIRYSGNLTTPPASTTYSNADLSLFSDSAHAGSVPFGSTNNRGFAGTLTYSVSAIPEPSTYAAIAGGFALIGAMLWRRRPGSSN